MARVTLSPGAILFGKYRIERPLGEGGFARVYLATHLQLQVPRALKIVAPRAQNLSTTRLNFIAKRFRLEARMGARFGPSPYLVQVYDFEQRPAEGLLILVMEYMPGGSLKDRLRTRRPLGLDEAVALARRIAHGLALLHDEQVVHRDLKPGNILFDEDHNAKLADLGVIQIPGGPSRRAETKVRHPGTPAYMSPEQERGRAFLPPASDIYSLGIVLFEALTLRNPKTLPPGTRLRNLRSEVPLWLDHLVADMLHEDPRKRPWDGNALLALLPKDQAAPSRPFKTPRVAREPVPAAPLEDADDGLDEMLPPPKPPTPAPPPPPPASREARAIPSASSAEGADPLDDLLDEAVAPSSPTPFGATAPPPLPQAPLPSGPRKSAWVVTQRRMLRANGTALAVGPTHWAVGLNNYQLHIYPHKSKTPTKRHNIQALITTLSVFPEGQQGFVSGDAQGYVHLWQQAPAFRPRTLGHLQEKILSLVAVPSVNAPTRMFALTESGQVWEMFMTKPARFWGTPTKAHPVGMAWSWSAGGGLVIAEVTGRLTFWKPHNDKGWIPIRKWAFRAAWSSLALRGDFAFLGTEEGEVWLVDVIRGKTQFRRKAHHDMVRHVARHPQGWISAGWDQQLRAWDTHGQPIAASALPALPTTLTLDAQHAIWIACSNRQLCQWELQTNP